MGMSEEEKIRLIEVILSLVKDMQASGRTPDVYEIQVRLRTFVSCLPQ